MVLSEIAQSRLQVVLLREAAATNSTNPQVKAPPTSPDKADKAHAGEARMPRITSTVLRQQTAGHIESQVHVHYASAVPSPDRRRRAIPMHPGMAETKLRQDISRVRKDSRTERALQVPGSSPQF